MSFDLTEAQAYQDYSEVFQPELISKMFYGFKTAEIATPIEGVKGKYTLTEIEINDIIVNWVEGFQATPNAIKFKPRTLETHLCKVDLEIYPQKLAKTYMGLVRAKRIDPDELPWAQYLTDKIIEKMNAQMQLTSTAGVRIASPTTGTPLQNMVDGYQHIVADAVTAGDVTPTVTGAITNVNAIEKAELVCDSLDDAYKDYPTEMFVSHSLMTKLRQCFTNNYGKYTDSEFKLPNKPNVTVIPLSGLAGDFMMVTPKRNLIYSYTVEGDNVLRFEKAKRALAIMADFWIGFQIAIAQDGILAINDQ